MMRYRAVWQTTGLFLLLALMIVSVISVAQGTAPEIVFTGFPSEIDANGAPVYGYISFKDLDKDLSHVRFEVIAGTMANLTISPGWQYDPGVQGERSGTLQFTISAQGAGQYVLRLILVDAMGNESDPKEISFVAAGGGANMPPVAAFSVTSTSVMTGVPVSFDATASSDADGSIVDYEWHFGDGSSAHGQQPTHAYNSAGTFDVSLKVTDDAGDSDQSTRQLVVQSKTGCVPMACFSLNGSESDRASVEQVIYVGAHEPLILDGTCSVCASSYFVGIQRSDQWWNRYGPEASGWLMSEQAADIGHFDVRAFATAHGVVMEPGEYYRVGLAVAEPWDSVTRLVFINPDTGGGGTWIDDFDNATLNSAWTWIREDRSYWSLTKRPGSLCITTQMGSILFDNNNARNLLVQNAPTGDFVIETHVLFTPTEDYQMAGLLVYQDDDHFMMLGRAYCGGSQANCIGNGIYFDYEEGGSSSNYNLSTAIRDEAYLRIVRQGRRFTGYYSTDGQSWRVVGTVEPTEMSDVKLRVGIAAYGNTLLTPIPVYFDYFHVSKQ